MDDDWAFNEYGSECELELEEEPEEQKAQAESETESYQVLNDCEYKLKVAKEIADAKSKRNA